MKLSHVYKIMGWPLRFWRITTLPPAPIAHDIAFDELVHRLAERKAAAGDTPKQVMTDEEFKEKCAAMDARYYSLKSGEALGRLSHEEFQELHCMETGHGFRLDLYHRKHERLGQRAAYLP